MRMSALQHRNAPTGRVRSPLPRPDVHTGRSLTSHRGCPCYGVKINIRQTYCCVEKPTATPLSPFSQRRASTTKTGNSSRPDHSAPPLKHCRSASHAPPRVLDAGAHQVQDRRHHPGGLPLGEPHRARVQAVDHPRATGLADRQQRAGGVVDGAGALDRTPARGTPGFGISRSLGESFPSGGGPASRREPGAGGTTARPTARRGSTRRAGQIRQRRLDRHGRSHRSPRTCGATEALGTRPRGRAAGARSASRARRGCRAGRQQVRRAVERRERPPLAVFTARSSRGWTDIQPAATAEPEVFAYLVELRR